MQAARLPVADDVRTHDLDLAQAPVFQRARTATAPILEVSLVDLTTFNALMAVAVPVRDAAGRRDGVVVINLLLDDLSTLLRTVVDEQQRQGHPVMISMINEQGQLIATPERERLAQPALNELPGASDALAWEHAVLYERSDERLREIAQDNEHLYRRTVEEKQTLAAIMGNMSDGLVRTSLDGALLYANPGAQALTGLRLDGAAPANIEAVYAVLRKEAVDPPTYDRAQANAEARG